MYTGAELRYNFDNFDKKNIFSNPNLLAKTYIVYCHTNIEKKQWVKYGEREEKIEREKEKRKREREAEKRKREKNTMVKKTASNVKNRIHEYILYKHDKSIQMIYICMYVKGHNTW